VRRSLLGLFSNHQPHKTRAAFVVEHRIGSLVTSC
jgi:hypothetical protein